MRGSNDLPGLTDRLSTDVWVRVVDRVLSSMRSSGDVRVSFDLDHDAPLVVEHADRDHAVLLAGSDEGRLR